MSADYAPATWIPTDHHDGWGVFAPKWIIVHGTAGFQTAQQVGVYFQSNTPPSSTHYVVGRDGAVVQCVRESSAAWGNGPITGPAGVGGDGVHHDAWWDHVPDGNPNTVTFSIEHVKPSQDNSDLLTPAQQAASFALIKHLCATHGIPMRAADAQGGVTGHFSMDPVNRARCPGPYPWDALWSYLNGGTAMGWTRTSTGAKDSVGNTCGAGMADFIFSQGITSDAVHSTTAYNGIGDVYMPLKDHRTLVWTHADGASLDLSALPIAALEGNVQAQRAQIDDLKKQLAAALANQGDPLAAEALDVARRQKALDAKL